jgi:glyoxylase-like metal-dependent hydrolase (beta-lactamase superfamily II)
MTISTHFAVGGFATCYLVGPDEGGYGVLIDPGYLNAALFGHIEQRNLPPSAVLLTHTHASHCAGAAAIQKVFGAEIYAAAPAAELPTTLVAGGQDLRIGALTFEVLSTPGHSDDSVCYALRPVIFTGDTLAAGSIGSAATPQGRTTLQRSVRERLLSRADHEVVLPGHGPPTTIGIERRFNVHLQD